MTTMELLKKARGAKGAMALADTERKNQALLEMARALEGRTADILAANGRDLEAARGTISEVMLDRLALSPERIAGMAQGMREVAALPDPVGAVLSRVERPNGMVIEKTAVPMGVIAIIYESRPNVTSDAAALALKAGSACVLRGGKEAHRSAAAIVAALKEGLAAAGLPEDALQLVEDTSRASANELMTASGYVDLLIPRGGAGLIRACVDNATVPVIETGTGICHIYVPVGRPGDGPGHFGERQVLPAQRVQRRRGVPGGREDRGRIPAQAEGTAGGQPDSGRTASGGTAAGRGGCRRDRRRTRRGAGL